jgi:class 3 adenylate cyclase/tetratricopeptide (TPR) repeat protein
MATCEHCAAPNPTGFRFCGLCGAPLAQGPGTVDARKVVTALFCDVVGSTALASELDPETVHRILSRYFEDVGATIARHGGTIEKFAGDAIFAVFGIPVVHEDDALRAVRAAAEIRDRLPVLAADVGFELEFHIGLNTGLVHTDEERSLAIGDAVNVAARLQQAAGSGEILIGADTMRLVTGAVTAQRVPPLTLKGKAEPVEAFRLIETDSTSGWEPMEGNLVGREWELRLLRTAWEQTLAQRRCTQLTIIAPAGTGKSRLAHALLGELEVAATVLRGRCLHYGEGITFWPLREALTPLGEVAKPVLDGLAHGGGATPEELFLGVRQLLQSLAEERPIALLIEDLQWAEPMLLDLLGHVVELARDAAILVLCTARNEFLERFHDAPSPPLRSGSVLRLTPLGRPACEELLGEVGRELSPEARERVIATSEGNPLFLQELLALARQTGSVEVPPTIHALLSARLEQLPVEERLPLERGAVEGYVFHSGAVETLMVERSREEVAQHLSALQRRQLIRPHATSLPGQAAFRFLHQLFRDTAYERLPLAQRAALHERFADWALREGAGRPDLDEIIGWHLEQATRYRRELRMEPAPQLSTRGARHLHRAGMRAGERGDISAARSLLERALALVPESDRLRVDITLTLAERLIEAGDLGRADELLSLVEQGGSVSAQATLSRLDWRFFCEPDEAAPVIESTLPSMLAQFEREGDERGLARAHWLLFLMRWGTSRAMLAANEVRRAAEHARRAGDIGLWSRALGWYIATLIYGPRPVAEIDSELQAIERERPGPYLAACLALGRAEVERRRGRFGEAHELIDNALAGFRELGMRTMTALCEQSSAGISLSQGDAAAARSSLLRSEATLAEFQERATRSTALAMLARAQERLGAVDEAFDSLDRAEEVSAPGDVVNFVITHCTRARLAARSGDETGAERWARSAAKQAANTDFVGYQAEALLELARVLSMQGRADEAEAHATRALELFQAKDDLPGVTSALRFIDGQDPDALVTVRPGEGRSEVHPGI